MEKLKGKHNHTLTNILKVFTFALVLLFPFLVFMPTAFYYGFNEHATNEQQTELVYKYTTNEVNTKNDLIEGNTYYFNYTYVSNGNTTNVDNLAPYTNEFIDFYRVVNNDSDYLNIIDVKNCVYKTNNNNSSVQNRNIKKLAFFTTNGNYTNVMIYVWDTILTTNGITEYRNNYQGNSNGALVLKTDFIFTYMGDEIISDNAVNFIETLPNEYNELKELKNIDGTITQSMSNAWENMWQTPLFQWTNNTPFTATTNAFTSVFNISHESGLYNLVAYFITITAIYLVIDIVIGVATMLTHMISKQD